MAPDAFPDRVAALVRTARRLREELPGLRSPTPERIAPEPDMTVLRL